jgi:hypothetical protein
MLGALGGNALVVELVLFVGDWMFASIVDKKEVKKTHNNFRITNEIQKKKLEKKR